MITKNSFFSIAIWNKKRKNVYAITLLCCGIAQVGVLPFLLGKSYPVLFVCAILTLAIPLGGVYLFRRRFIDDGEMELTNEFLKITYSSEEFRIEWNQIKCYGAEHNVGSQLLSYPLLRLIIKDKSNQKKVFWIVEENLITSKGEIRKDSVLDSICYYISCYNSEQIEDFSKIKLIHNPLTGNLTI